MAGEEIKFEATAGDEGERLDLVLARGLGISRSRAAAILKSGKVRGTGIKAAKPSTIVRAGEIFTLPEPEESPRGARATAENIPLAVLYEDEHLIVIDKPAGMVVHPAPGHYSGTLVNALLAHINNQPDSRLEALRPGIVHRLDKDTSGLLVVARTFEAHLNLSEQIKNRQASRIYLAISCGHWPKREDTIDAPIGRSRKNRQKMSVSADGGREAITSYRVLQSFSIAELVQVRLLTGRTHQIRVHFAYRGHPVLGDPLYGGRVVLLKGFNSSHPHLVSELLGAGRRQALHAAELSFTHPFTGEKMHFSSPLPSDMNDLLQILSRENP